MKKALLFAAVALMSTSALASKARRTALGNVRDMSDISDIAGDVQVGGMYIARPDKAMAYGEWALMELGKSTTAATTTAVAEGGFVRMMGSGALGAYLGAPNKAANDYRVSFDTAAATTTLKQENPLRVFYASKAGDMTWGAGLLYSSSKTKNDGATITSSKQDASGVVVSASTDVWDAQLGLGLSNNATTTVTAGDNSLTGKATAQLTGGYKMDTLYFYGAYGMQGAKGDKAGASTVLDRADNEITLGVMNSHKKDGTNFFYGIEYDATTAKEDASTPTSLGANKTKIETTNLPLYVGIEAEAASWLILRASIKHTVGLLGLAKVKSSTNNSTDSEVTGADATTVAAGAGIKWNKFMLDGVLAASSGAANVGSTNKASDNGAIGSDANFLTNASLTYTF